MSTRDYDQFHIEQLRHPEEAAAYLSACLEEGQDVFLLALRDVARAQGIGMKQLADDAQLNRENLYRMLADAGNPNLSSISTVLHELGFQLQRVPVELAKS